MIEVGSRVQADPRFSPTHVHHSRYPLRWAQNKLHSPNDVGKTASHYPECGSPVRFSCRGHPFPIVTRACRGDSLRPIPSLRSEYGGCRVPRLISSLGWRGWEYRGLPIAGKSASNPPIWAQSLPRARSRSPPSRTQSLHFESGSGPRHSQHHHSGIHHYARMLDPAVPRTFNSLPHM